MALDDDLARVVQNAEQRGHVPVAIVMSHEKAAEVREYLVLYGNGERVSRFYGLPVLTLPVKGLRVVTEDDVRRWVLIEEMLGMKR